MNTKPLPTEFHALADYRHLFSLPYVRMFDKSYEEFQEEIGQVVADLKASPDPSGRQELLREFRKVLERADLRERFIDRAMLKFIDSA